MFLYLAIFLLVAAGIIAVSKPKTKGHVWLLSLLVPLGFSFFFGFCMALFSGSSMPIGYQLGRAIGGTVPCVFVSILTLFFCLKKKQEAKKDYKFPKGIFVTIIVCVIIGCIQLFMSYQSNKAVENYMEMKSQGTVKTRMSSDENKYTFNEVKDFRDGILDTARKMTKQVPIQINEIQTLIAVGVTDNLITYKYEIAGWDGNIEMSVDEIERTKALAILNLIRSQQYPDLFLECLRRMELEFQLMFFSEDRKYIGGFRLSYSDFINEAIDESI